MKKLLFVLVLGAFMASCGSPKLEDCTICYADIVTFRCDTSGGKIVCDTFLMEIKGIYCLGEFTIDSEQGPMHLWGPDLVDTSWFETNYGLTFLGGEKHRMKYLKFYNDPPFDCFPSK